MRITTPKASHAEILARIAREVVEEHRKVATKATERFPDDGYQGLIQPMTVEGDYVLPERFQVCSDCGPYVCICHTDERRSR